MRLATGSPSGEARNKGPRRGIALLMALFCALAMAVPISACSEADEGSANEAVIEKAGTLALELDVEDWEDGVVPVRVSGSQEDGEKIDATLNVVPGDDIELTYGAGDYTFSINGSDISTDSVAYEDIEKDVRFDGSEDCSVTLVVAVDDEATAALAEEAAARAEEEQRAREEEEARAAAQAEAEAAARAQAEAEAAAQAQAEAEAAAQAQAEAEAQKNEQTVYITNTGKKYHNAGCRYLKSSSIPISLSQAQAQGYTPCKVCH